MAWVLAPCLLGRDGTGRQGPASTSLCLAGLRYSSARPIPPSAPNPSSEAMYRVLKRYRYKASERAEWVSLAGNRWPHLAAVKVGLGMAGISGQDDGIGERCHLVSGVAYLDPDEC